MLPGFGDAPESFDDHGFVGLLPRAKIDADVVAVGARMKYYADRDLLPALEEEVIGPAREKGYEKIWVLGISMGGLGALLAAREFPEDIDGVVLLSPFLGSKKTLESIAAAGGAASWNPPAQESKDYTVELWRWLKAYATEPKSRPQMFLAYGTKENNRPHALLGDLLPKSRVIPVPEGRHGWGTWEKALPELIARGALA
jgi:pimeloyl-ACP methyl ester carboxylesterase